MMNEISIIVPCISTMDPLPRFIDKLARYLMDNPSEVDCLVVANEQTEKPEELMDYVQSAYPWLKFIMMQRKGKARSFGALVRFGLAYSTSRYAVLVSPYGEDDLSIIPEMLGRIRQGAQVVQATRYTKTEDIRSVPFLFRFYQYIYRFLTRILLNAKITDSTYGFKMFDRAFIQALGLTHNGYSVCPEITLKSILAGGKVEYVPSSVMKIEKGNRDFKLHREGLGYLWLLIRGAGHRLGILWF